MTEDAAISGFLLVYKFAVLACGLLSIYMGYRLFLADKGAPAGDLSVTAKEYALSLKGGAPGIFFSLFGTVLIAFTIYKGFNIVPPEETSAAQVTSAATLPPVQLVVPEQAPFPD